ncbi:MAG TPA: hypothetical protein VE035_12570 [Puia sp.]|nr:hypothetical protein [Puia sp.]
MEIAPNRRKGLEAAAGGLSLMSFFTAMWGFISENSLRGKDHWISGLILLIVIVFFIYYYFYFQARVKGMASIEAGGQGGETPEEKKKGKWFGIIFGLEGLAILVVINVLNNTGHPDYFIPCFALIVGLHFFPLGILFQRKFDHFMGAWTCLIAMAGIYLTNQGSYSHQDIVAIVGLGCAAATTGYGIRMILKGKEILLAENAAATSALR